MTGYLRNIGGVNKCIYSPHRTHLKQEWAKQSSVPLILWGQGWPGLGQGLRNCPQSRNRFPGNETTSLYSCSWELFILVCIVWNCWRTCLLCLLFNYLCGVCVCVHFYAQYNVFLPERVCHEHHFGLNSRIAAPKFCTKSRFYFLKGNLFEQFAPTLPKSKIAWMEILFSAIWAKLKVLTISSLQFSQQFWLFSTPCNTHLP